MKNLKLPLILLTSAFIAFNSCKKSSDDTKNNKTPCNFSSDVISVDGTVKNIIKTDCKVFGSTYYSEHLVDTLPASVEGAVMVFNDPNAPAAGNYTAVSDIAQVAAGTVYVEYYKLGDSWQAASGTVTVSVTGGTNSYALCNLTFSQAGGSSKTVSLRATCN